MGSSHNVLHHQAHSNANFNETWIPGGARGYSLDAVFYQASGGNTADVTVSIVMGDTAWTVDSVIGANSYVFPSATFPHPLSIPPSGRVRVTTANLSGGTHDLLIVLSEEANL